MGIAALIIGIVSLIISFIPFCGTWAAIPAIVGIILGIVDLVKKKKAGLPKGKSIAGIICSAIAVVVIVVWWIIAIVTAAGAAAESAELYDAYDYDYDYSTYDYDWDY